jgi:hypothetical protein
MANPWDLPPGFEPVQPVSTDTEPQRPAWAPPPGFEVVEEDLDTRAIPRPGVTPNSTPIEPRTGDFLKPYFGGNNPIAETYDHFVAPFVEELPEERQKELAKRGILERAADTASFVGSAPIRMFTRDGRYGLGDLVGTVAPETGESISASERDFINANREWLQVAKNVGDVSIGVPAMQTMGRVGPAQLPAPSKVPTGVSKANQIGLKSRGQQYAKPTDANRAARIQLRKDFEDAGMTPFGPSFSSEGVQGATHTLGKQPFVGTPIANAARNSFSEAKAKINKVADDYGSSRTYEDAGRVAERGLDRFKNERVIPKEDIARMSPSELARVSRQPDNMSSVKTKADVLYERAWRHIPDDMQKGKTKLDLPAVKGNMTEAQNVIRDIARRNLGTLNSAEYERIVKEARAAGVNPESALAKSISLGKESHALPVTGNSHLARMIKHLHSGEGRFTLQGMRDTASAIKRESRRLQNSDSNALGRSDVIRIERAATRDIANMLERNATAYADKGEALTAARMRRSAKLFREADRYYAGAMKRMESVERLFGAKTAEALRKRIEDAARGQSRGDHEMLRTLKTILRPDEFDDVASSILREMGTPTGSRMVGTTGELGFSVSTLNTNWNKMTPQARQILFQSSRNPEAFGDLSRLMKIVNSFADFEATANASRSTTNAIGTLIITGGAGQIIGMPVTTMMTLLGTRGVAKFLTTPTYVKWMTRAAKLERRYSRSRSPAMARQIQAHWAKLRPLLNDDPQMMAEVSRVLATAVGQASEQEGTEQ